MNNIYLVIALGVANIGMVISPGPDFVLIVRNTVRGGRLCGIATAVGASTGIAIHVAYCCAGVATVVHQSHALLIAMRWCGAGYLVWVGVKSFKAGAGHREAPSAVQNGNEGLTLGSSFMNGLVTNLLNVKALLFFLSIFSIAVAPLSPLWVYVALALVFVLSTLVWFTFVSSVVNAAAVRRFLERNDWMLTRLAGAVLIVLGVAIVVA